MGLRKEVEEVEAFLEEAEGALTKKLLQKILSTLENEADEEDEETREAEAEAEAAAAAKKAEKEKAAKKAAEKEAKAAEEQKQKEKEAQEAKEKAEKEEKEAKEAAKAKAKAEEAEEEEEEKPKKKEHKDPVGGDETTPGGLVITAKCAKALKKLKSGLGRNAKNTAAICTIKKQGTTFELEEWLDDCDIEDINDELTELNPKYIFYRYSFEVKFERLGIFFTFSP